MLKTRNANSNEGSKHLIQWLILIPASIRYPQADKLASLRRAVGSPVDARVETFVTQTHTDPNSGEVTVTETRRVVETRIVETRRGVERESMPPPYSTPTPTVTSDDSYSELSEDPFHLDCQFDYSG